MNAHDDQDHSAATQSLTTKVASSPVSAAVGAATATSQTEQCRGHGETILVVDDEEPMCQLCRLILHALGYTVLTASSPAAAMQLVTQHPGDIQLVLTDFHMPGANGRQLAERLVAVRPGLKVLYMSGYLADVFAPGGAREPGIVVIGKPFTRAALAHQVRATLDRP